jgi:hypothetical protein
MNCAYTDAKFQDDLSAPQGQNYRTSYIQLTGFEAGKAVLNIGKVLDAGEIFYVEGVRYEVPAVQTINGELAYLTIRTPLPKSDPYGTWTSVSVDSPTIEDESRENNRRVDGYNEFQFQVVDSSKVTTQFLVEFDWTDPLPVNPPFNHEVYRQVDDTDVQLWECGPNPENPDNSCHGFPHGLADDGDGLPQTTNMPPWLFGASYMTQANPPQAWIDWFDAELTTVGQDLSNLLLRSSFEDGLNWHAWNVDDDISTSQISDHTLAADTTACTAGAVTTTGNTCDTTFYWVKEWYEGRYTTNLQEIPQFGQGDYSYYEINSHPDQYTAFVFPDRANPASFFEDENNLHFSDDSDSELCTRGDIFVGSGIDPQQTGSDCDATFSWLGGDYLVTTSFILEDVGGGEGPHHPFDTKTGETNNGPFDCAFNVNEVFAGINIYLADTQNVNVNLVFQSINAYLSGPPVGSYSSSQPQFAQYTGCP